MADAQTEELHHEQHKGGPCSTIREAAGLHGAGRQHKQCHRIRMLALKDLREAELADDIIKGLEVSITIHVVNGTAEQILRLPELLTLPECVEEYMGRQAIADLQATGGPAKTLLRLCFVHSPKVKLTYYTHQDMARAHQRQVKYPTYIIHDLKNRLVD